MSEAAESAAASPVRGARSYLVLGGLVLGLGGGALAARAPAQFGDAALATSQFVGGLWLNGLKMTVIPLIIALLVTAVANGAAALRSGRIAARAIVWFLAIYFASAVVGAVAMPPLLHLFPLPDSAAAALRTGLASISPSAVPSKPPGVLDFFEGVVPSNIFESASNGDVLALVVFAMTFAIAVTRIPEERRLPLTNFFAGAADALLIVIGWVLWLAPLGVFALGFSIALGAGIAAFGALAHYILLVSALGVIILASSYVLAFAVGGLPLRRFAKAEIAPQAVAISTRSSLACLPAMLAAARNVGIRDGTANIVLPLAVALFRPTGPAMNVGVVVYVAYWLGLDTSLPHVMAAVAVATIISIGSVSVPGEVSYISAVAPVAMAMGVPIAPLAILVAVEMIPDTFRTIGNVTMDVAVAGAIDRRLGDRTA